MIRPQRALRYLSARCGNAQLSTFNSQRSSEGNLWQQEDKLLLVSNRLNALKTIGSIEKQLHFMTYAYDLENGQRLIVENDGDNTLVTLRSGGEGQQQSQATGFDTGKWSKAPALFRVKQGLVLRVETKGGSEFIGLRGNRIQSIRGEPDLEDAEKLKLRESDEIVRMKPMEAMKPMRSMRPMEMRMGNMQMRMGGTEDEPKSGKRFCTKCGKPAQKDDRYCAYCGNKLAD